MTNKKKVFICGAVIVALVTIAFACGFGIGIYEYYKYNASLISINNASQTTRVLETLRNGDTDTATLLLETQLDGFLLEHGVGLNDGRPSSLWADVPTEEQVQIIMGRVAAYREKHPFDSGKPSLQESVERTLERYRK